MKHLCLFLFFALIGSATIALAQNLAPTPQQPYIITQTPREPISTTITANTPVSAVQTTIQYFDALGRPAQNLIWRGDNKAKNDIISQNITYDAIGRPTRTTLPAPNNNSNGQYRQHPTPNAQNFYADNDPYAQTNYETSPLNRIATQTGPGQNWRTPIVAATKSSSVSYGTANNVIYFSFSTGCNCLYGHLSGSTAPNYYGPNDVSTQTTTNEQNQTTLTYTEVLQGRTIRRDVQTATATLTTAYVYDEYDRLAAVIPPNAYNWFMADISRTLNVTTNNADDPTFSELVYSYLYDNRGRVVRKNTPGAGWTDLVYDTSDRLVMSQDAQDKAEVGGTRWRFTKYDGLGRVLQTGRMALAQSASALQLAFSVTAGTAYPPFVNPGTTDLLTESQYDNYTGAAFAFNTSGALGSYWPNATGLLTRSRVKNLETGAWYESVYWYDNKNRPIQQQSQNHLGGTDRTDNQYRFNGELLQTVLRHQPASNAAITTVVSSYTYDHVGRKTQANHSVNGVSTVLAVYEYDAIGRLVGKSLGGGAGAASQQNGNWNVGSTWQSGSMPGNTDRVLISASHAVTIPSNTTVGAGRLVYGRNGRLLFSLPNSRLRLNGQGSGQNTVQVVRYQYHIRGGLRGINLESGSPTTSNGQLFAMKLGYEDAGYYDGNIGSQTWLTANQPTTPRSYTYTYDGASRLTKALYTGIGTENFALTNVTYDANGNLTALARNGLKTNSTYGQVDNLSYTYQANSNKIQAVTDNSGDAASFSDVTGSTDYTYYADGSTLTK